MKRHRRIKRNQRALLVCGILLGAAMLALGLSGCFDKAEAAAGDRSDEIASSVSETRDTPKPESIRAESEASEEPEPVDTVEDTIAKYVASLSLREKLCQMLIVTPETIISATDAAGADAEAKSALEQYPVGGLIHFTQNITSADQITRFNANVQAYAKTPMFIAVDEEGGNVSRLRVALNAHNVGAMLAYEKNGEEGAAANAKILANALKQYGFNTDFAPVADVWSNPANTVIGNRAYSSDFENAARLVAAAVRGFHESDIVCSLKHFPGHGDTREDSHDGTAYVHKTLEELRAGEFKPFAAGIAAGADMVMVGHLIVPAVDDAPATLSKKLVTDLLRGELGFDGVIITDSLAMGAVASKYSAEYVAVTAVRAGIDILLMPSDVEKTIAALTSAVESGDLPESRIDESVTRIIRLKTARGMIAL